jgi:hypothetical protein
MTPYLERDGKLVEMTKQSYAAEDVLQKLIATYPELLAGDEDPSDRNRWVLIEREVPVADRPDAAGRWSLDHLFVDQDGVPTLVEVKRSSDTRIRREVVGQMLEYAANGPRYWPLSSVRAQFEARCSRDGDEPDEVLQGTFGEALDVEAWWKAVETNLREGTLRLVFLADEISQELKAIIEFLNEQMVRTTVLGVEVPQFAGGDENESHRMFVPVVIGLSERAESVKTGPKSRRWTTEQWLERHDERAEREDTAVTRQLLAWAGTHDVDVAFGTAMTNPSMKLERPIGDRHVSVVRVYPDGTIEVNFGHLAAPFDNPAGWRELADRLQQIDGVTIPPERQFPTFPISLIRPEDQLARFTETIEWAFGEMGRASTNQSPDAGITSPQAGSGAPERGT